MQVRQRLACGVLVKLVDQVVNVVLDGHVILSVPPAVQVSIGFLGEHLIVAIDHIQKRGNA
jgi:hypothetical protein